MAPSQVEPLNLEVFWRLYGKLVTRLMRERAHAEVVILMRAGDLTQVRINRSYLPRDLPEL